MVEFDYATFGIIGLETAFALCYTERVQKQVISLPKLIEKLTKGPAEVMGIDNFDLAEGSAADLVVIDPAAEYIIDKNTFKSKARNTPFDGFSVTGRIERTLVGGKTVFQL